MPFGGNDWLNLTLEETLEPDVTLTIISGIIGWKEFHTKSTFYHN